MVSRLALALSLLFLLSATALARPVSNEGLLARSYPQPPVLARAAVVLDARTGNILAEFKPHLRLPMASTTKIMTAVVALQLGKLTDRITVPKSAFNYEWDATVMGLKPGNHVTLLDLLYGLLLPSGADAANTIAIHYAGSEAKFIALMNREAATLGLHDTHYSDTTGLTSVHHYTTALDLARLARYASGLPAFMKVVNTKYHTWNGHVLTNVNHVLFWYPGVDGIKPGYTNEAGICQTLDAWRHGRHVIAAILNTPNLVTDARNLLNYGLRDFTWIQSALPGDNANVVQGGADGKESYAYFPSSGHTIRGAFRRTFNADGGLSTLGFPRTEVLQESSLWVQYFQNGALAQDSYGRVYRLPLGLTTASAIPPPPPPAKKRARTDFATAAPAHTATPRPQPETTATPHPSPTTTHPVPTPSPTVTPRPTVATEFTWFQHKHASLLGIPVAQVFTRSSYDVQLFAYGALAFDRHAHRVLLLPLGDRFLSARGWLGYHPGNAYPTGFASISVLRAIGWFPHGVPYVSPTR